MPRTPRNKWLTQMGVCTLLPDRNQQSWNPGISSEGRWKCHWEHQNPWSLCGSQMACSQTGESIVQHEVSKKSLLSASLSMLLLDDKKQWQWSESQLWRCSCRAWDSKVFSFCKFRKCFRTWRLKVLGFSNKLPSIVASLPEQRAK